MRLIVLDRDGVINLDSETYIKSVDEWIPIPGSIEAIARLNHGGYRVVVASNQSGLARGLFTIDELNAIHRKMHRELARLGGQIEAVFFCPHSERDRCRCRKPQPGLLKDIGNRLLADFSGTPVVGDALRDIQSAWAVGATPLLVLTGKGKRTLAEHKLELTGISIYKDLAAVADELLA